jgi:hypothetical protein
MHLQVGARMGDESEAGEAHDAGDAFHGDPVAVVTDPMIAGRAGPRCDVRHIRRKNRGFVTAPRQA